MVHTLQIYSEYLHVHGYEDHVLVLTHEYLEDVGDQIQLLASIGTWCIRSYNNKLVVNICISMDMGIRIPLPTPQIPLPSPLFL